jgi:plasmid stabilization system protein ParE
MLDFCETLSVPERGTARDDIRPGVRVVSFRGRVAIAFTVAEDTVCVLGFCYGGRDDESLLRAGPDEPG